MSFKEFYSPISQKEGKKLIKEKCGKIDILLQEKYCKDIYLLSDSSVLYIIGRYGYLFKNQNDLVSYHKYRQDLYKNQKQVVHDLEYNFNYDSIFISRISSFSTLASHYFKIKDENLFTIKSLKEIDKKISSLDFNEKHKEKIFPMLVAYLGETFKKNKKIGTWICIKDDYGFYESLIKDGEK